MSQNVFTEIARLASLIKPYWGRWVWATLMLFAGGAINLALPQLLGLAIDEGIVVGDEERLRELVLVGLLASLVLGGCVVARHVLMTWLGKRVITDVRLATFRHLLRHPPGYFDTHKTGEVLSRLSLDTYNLGSAVSSDFSVALRASFTLVGCLTILFWKDPLFALLLLLTIPCTLPFGKWMALRVRRRASKVQDHMASANARLHEAIVGIRTVQGYQAEGHEAERYRRQIIQVIEHGVGIAWLRGVFMALVQVGGYCALILMIGMGGRAIIDGSITPGTLSLGVLYTLMVIGSMVTLANIWSNLNHALGATERIFALLAEEPDMEEGQLIPMHSRGEFTFENVTFSYPSRPQTRVLDGVDFTIQSGQQVALVGASGVGKSTIAALLYRFYDPQQGRVLMDGHDVRDLTFHCLRNLLGMVLQEPMIFSGTIADNIRYGAPDAKDEAIVEAAKQANIAEFIDSLPDGYATEVGERGITLSGGQRQRLAIARAFLANPKLLILDEATCHLDQANEEMVNNALERLLIDRSALIITHRLSSVRKADRILYLENGRVKAIGTHAELSEVSPTYCALLAS
jgi:ATP-binding cassette subfamily B protein